MQTETKWTQRKSAMQPAEGNALFFVQPTSVTPARPLGRQNYVAFPHRNKTKLRTAACRHDAIRLSLGASFHVGLRLQISFPTSPVTTHVATAATTNNRAWHTKMHGCQRMHRYWRPWMAFTIYDLQWMFVIMMNSKSRKPETRVRFLPRDATQSADMRQYVAVCLSVRLSVRDVQVRWSHMLEYFDNNITAE